MDKPEFIICPKCGAFGYRVAGRKAWGNPYNKPIYTFKTDADEFIELINKYKYEVKE